MALIILYLILTAVIVSAVTYLLTKSIILKKYNERNSSLEKEIETKSQEIEYVKAKQAKFWNVITHELRNVFYKLYNSVDLLNVEFDELNEEEKKMLIQTISKSYNYTLDVINDLTEWTKVNLNNPGTAPENINLRVIVEEIIINMREKFLNKEIEIKHEFTDDLPVYCDRMMLIFIIKNILSNALKYSYRKGTVNISYYKVGKKIDLKITDYGMGMPKEDTKKLFNIEEIFSTEGTEKEKGVGLGLIISKDFIESNNGSIQLISAKEKGTTVILTLPAAEK